MALMMAGYCPEYFEAIAAFVPITDLKKWADYNKSYRRHILACCSSDEAEMAKRSPMSYIEERPEIVSFRTEFGHWEIDTVIGKKDEGEPCVLPLTERMTRMCIWVKA